MNVLSEFQQKIGKRNETIYKMVKELQGKPMAVYHTIALKLRAQGIKVTPERVRQIVNNAKKEGKL